MITADGPHFVSRLARSRDAPSCKSSHQEFSTHFPIIARPLPPRVFCCIVGAQENHRTETGSSPCLSQRSVSFSRQQHAKACGYTRPSNTAIQKLHHDHALVVCTLLLLQFQTHTRSCSARGRFSQPSAGGRPPLSAHAHTAHAHTNAGGASPISSPTGGHASLPLVFVFGRNSNGAGARRAAR